MIKPLHLLTLALTAATLDAAVVVTDSFNSYSEGVIPTGTLPNVWITPGAGAGTVDNGTDLTSRIVTDTANIFGQGAANNYLRMSDTSSTTTDNFNLATNLKTIGQIGTVAFNFYSPTFATPQGDGFLLRIGTAAGNGATTFGLFINNGLLMTATASSVTAVTPAFATYSLNTVQALAIVFNSSATDLVYGSRTLAAGKMDVYLNGSLVGSALDGAGSLAGTVATNASVGFTRKSTPGSSDFMGTLDIDDFNIYSGVETSAIPEPATTVALAGAGALLLAGLLRRRS